MQTPEFLWVFLISEPNQSRSNLEDRIYESCVVKDLAGTRMTRIWGHDMCMTFPFLIAMHCDDLNHNRESTNPGFSRAASRSEDCVVACFQISCRNITPEASFMAFARHLRKAAQRFPHRCTSTGGCRKSFLQISTIDEDVHMVQLAICWIVWKRLTTILWSPILGTLFWSQHYLKILLRFCNVQFGTSSTTCFAPQISGQVDRLSMGVARI